MFLLSFSGVSWFRLRFQWSTLFKWPPRFQSRDVVALPALSDFLLKWQGTGFCSHRWMCEIWHTETFVLKEQNRVEIEFIKNLNTSWMVGISDTMSCHHLNSGFRYADQKKIEDSEILRPDFLCYFDEYTYKLFRCMKKSLLPPIRLQNGQYTKVAH